MDNEDLKAELMESYKDWEYHQRTRHDDEFEKGEILWQRYVYCRNRWHESHTNFKRWN